MLEEPEMDPGFTDEIRASYQLADPALVLGSALHDGTSGGCQPLVTPPVSEYGFHQK